jgi:hypothetical protein
VSFAAITLCVASELVFIVVSVYFVIDSIRNLLVTPSYYSLVCPAVVCTIMLNFDIFDIIVGKIKLSLYLTKYHFFKFFN